MRVDTHCPGSALASAPAEAGAGADKGVKPRMGEVYRETTKLLATYAKVRLTPSSFPMNMQERYRNEPTMFRCSSSLRADVKYASTMHSGKRGIDIPGLLRANRV